MEARHRLYGLGLPRQWKVITSTLLLLFTFAIGNVWADTEYVLIDYSSTPAKTDNFINTTSLSAFSSSITFTEADESTTTLSHYVAATNKAVSGQTANDGHFVYDLKTTSADVKIYVYNKNKNDKNVYVSLLSECEQVNETVSVKTKKAQIITKSVTCTTGGTRIVISGNTSDVQFAQIIITEKGSAVKSFGEDGYTLNGKRVAVKDKSGSYDGAQIVSSSDVKYMNADICKPTVSSSVPSGYIKFTTPNNGKNVLLTIGHSSSKAVVVDELSELPATNAGYSQLATAVTETKAKLGPNKTYMIFSINSSPTINTLAFYIPKVTYNANGGSETMSATEWTVAANSFTAPSGKKFDGWKDDDDNVYTVGQEVLEDVTLYAQWKDDAPEYTVTYKDGETTLKSVNVAVGSAPDAYNPTKDFYSFAAWQKDAIDYDPADLASDASANDEITLTARWTAQYTSGTYEFTGHLTMGTAPNQMTIANSSDGSSYDAGRIDNIYVSAQKIGYQNDGGDYDGWKLKTTNGTLRFMVENACGVRVTLGEANPLRIAYTEGSVAKTADIAKSTTSSVYKADANTLVTLTNITSGNKTVTLKKIEILPLYNATYTDGKGDASGSASNVTEVTLPTPSETTVGGYSFTGWVANQTVYDGETPKTTGEALNAGGTYTLTATTTFTAQWALIADFDVKFFQGYGDPDVQIGETQSISTGGYAVAPTDPVRDGYRFLGWSTDGTEANIVTVASYVISVATDFTAVWIQQFEVTFDGAGAVSVDNGATVASPDSPTQTGKIFQGWYNGESKYDFSAAVTGNLALESKWAVANPNHFYYTYNDDFHFDGVVYKTPEGKTTDPEAAEATLNMTTPYTVYSGAEGITSIIATNGVYDYKKGADTKHVTAYLKLKKNDATSNLAFTIKSGYTAVLKIKMGGYSNNPVVTLKKGDDAVPATSGTIGGTATGKNYNEITYDLTAGTYVMTSADQTLYISHIDLEATALPTHTVTYKAGDGTGADVVDADATEVADCPGTFTAPTGKVFNGWKNESDASDVAVGAIVEDDMNLIAQWINHYAVTFNMNGHGDAIDPQDIKEGAKAAKPVDPVVIGWDFGGWFTDNGTFEAPFDFNTAIIAATPLYAKWTAFDGCTLLVPATSGDAPAVGDPISMQTGSKGGSMSVVGTPLSYNAYGLSFESSSSAKAKVTINSEIQEGTVISLTLVANGTSSPRGLHLYTGDGATKIESLGWTSDMTKYTEETYTYTVQSTDVALIGSNEFQLWRNGSVFLKQLTVTNCGDPVISHNLTSTVNIAGKGTVTLGASSVREGHTTTATYSDIDAAYEFVSWSISGAGASIADATANPATITMGTEDAVVTLNLQVKPVYYTVTYYDGASEMGTEQVAENGHPTATGIATKKLGYTFDGWSETDGGAVVNLEDLSITAAKNLYAKYTAVVCPTSGTVYKFQLKTDLTDGNVFDTKPNSVAFTTDNYLSVLTGGILTGAIDNNNVNRLQFFDNKAVGFASGSGGTLTIGLDCALAEGDVIKYINYANSNNKMTLSDAIHTQTLDGNGTEEVQTWDVPAAWAGATELTLVRGGNTPKLTYFEIYRRPVATGATLADLTIRQGQSKTPVMTLEPSADARVTSQVWEIVGTPTNLTGAAIDPATGAITTGTLDDPTSTGSISVKVTLNGSIEATCTATVVGNIAQQDVTKSTVWDWHNTGATANIQLTNSTDPKKNENFVLANVAVNNNDEFESDKLAVEGEHMVRDYDKTDPYFQGQLIQFHTTVAGVVRVKFAHTGNATEEKPARELYINGVATGDTRANATPAWSNYIEVPAGDVSITAYYVNLLPVATQQYIRVFEIEFFAYDTERADSWIAPGELGTICYPNGHIITGAEVYEMAGVDENNKFVFDQVEKTEPGKPYLFVATSYEPIKLYKTTAAAEVSPIANNGMIGTFVSIDLDYTDERAAKWYYFSGKKFYAVSKRTSNLNVPANRAYVDMNTPVPAGAPRHGVRRITFDVQGTNIATGVENAAATDKPAKMLINGQLFILRGEKMYDAKGQLVK